MTIAQHGVPQTQAGPATGPLGAGGPPMPPQGFGWQPAPPPARTKRSQGLAIAISAVGVLAAAALVVGIVALVRPAPVPSVALPSGSAARQAGSTEVNRAFCSDLAPLMAESNKTAQAYSHLGAPNTPEWKAGAQIFITDTKAWLTRIQPVIDSHGDADPFLLRNMQRFVDDRRDLVADLASGDDAPSWLPYDQTNWNDSLSAGSGPSSFCFDLGVKW
jgi:hypothetical protein